MRFHVDIDQVTEGRPEGRLRPAPGGPDVPFTGWVELLRLMEQHYERPDLGGTDVGHPTGGR